MGKINVNDKISIENLKRGKIGYEGLLDENAI